MTREQKINLVWWNTHSDFKAEFGGGRYILVWDNGSKLRSVTDLSDEELNQRLPKANKFVGAA